MVPLAIALHLTHFIAAQFFVVSLLTVLLYALAKNTENKQFYRSLIFGFLFNIGNLVSVGASSLWPNHTSWLEVLNIVLGAASAISFYIAIRGFQSNGFFSNTGAWIFGGMTVAGIFMKIYCSQSLVSVLFLNIHYCNLVDTSLSVYILFVLGTVVVNLVQDKRSRKIVKIAFMTWALIQFLEVISEVNTDTTYLKLAGFSLGLMSKLGIIIGLFIHFKSILSRQSEIELRATSLEHVFGKTYHELTHPLLQINQVLKGFINQDGHIEGQSVKLRRDEAEALSANYAHLISIIEASKQMFVKGTGRNMEEMLSNLQIVNPPTNESINTVIQTVVLRMKLIKEGEDKYKNFDRASFEFDFGGNCNVNYRFSEMFQVFENIFKNAVEAINGKRITIFVRTRVETIENPEAASQESRSTLKIVQIDIRNDGPELSLETAEKMFELGFSTKSNSNQQRGMGLDIVKNNIEKNHGSILLVKDINPDTGLIPVHFRITFPKAI